MEITIRNSPYRREDSMEDRREDNDSLAFKPPQQMSRKEKAHHREDEKREKRGKRARVKGKEREQEHWKRHREEQDEARSSPGVGEVGDGERAFQEREAPPGAAGKEREWEHKLWEQQQ
ncbi:Cyclin-dependent kinase 11A [Myotis davidii]|uniref:Cyclin-dependent kinase 11A n=1 Tax=Myotis davidii TaxID=225400 RepID=L5LZ72_MYODS|nr:Cyclin-dependent kinase 11A [Myotis davidii]